MVPSTFTKLWEISIPMSRSVEICRDRYRDPPAIDFKQGRDPPRCEMGTSTHSQGRSRRGRSALSVIRRGPSTFTDSSRSTAIRRDRSVLLKGPSRFVDVRSGPPHVRGKPFPRIFWGQKIHWPARGLRGNDAMCVRRLVTSPSPVSPS